MRTEITTLAIGFVSGVMSGAFGIGGGIITTPAIRLILGAPALVAVGTPLPVILPGALTGAYSYLRAHSADLRSGLTIGLVGAPAAVLGAWATRYAGGTLVLLATAAVVIWAAVDMIVQALAPPRVAEPAHAAGAADEGVVLPGDAAPDARDAGDAPGAPGGPAPHAGAIEPAGLLRLAVIGCITGLYSGFLGLGGGFVIVPLSTRWLRMPIKFAIGTSLVAVSVLAVPGTITHAMLGNIDWRIALFLTLGVVPGAVLGSRLSLGAADRSIRLAFSAMLVAVGLWLALSELGIGPWAR